MFAIEEKFWGIAEFFTVKGKAIWKSIYSTLKEFVELLDWNHHWKTPVALTMLGIAGVCVAIWGSTAIWLMALAPIAFIQNMFFTLVSRSRNSKDTDYHRYCAWGSNGVWFICQVMIVKNVWAAIHAGNWWYALLAGIVYSYFTTEGSVLMMKKLIRSEKGKRRVGANDKIDALVEKVEMLETDIQALQGFK